jgi:hypothetical protein
VVLGFELRAYTTPPAFFFFVKGFFEIGSHKLFALADFKLLSPDLCLLSSSDYKHEPPASELS